MKAAAKLMISQLQDLTQCSCLTVSPITIENRNRVKEQVNGVISFLRHRGLITSYSPRYMIGSTRLWSDFFNVMVLGPGETENDVESAKSVKTELGDLDVDLVFTVNPRELLDALTLEYPNMVGRLCGQIEINTLFKIDDTAVQIDLVNISTCDDVFYSQFSSVKDMKVGLRGAFRDILARSIVSSFEFTSEQLEALTAIEAAAASKLEAGCKVRPGETISIASRRYSLGHNSLKAVAECVKTDTNGVKRKTVYSVPYFTLLGADESAILIDSGIVLCAPLDDITATHSAVGLNDKTALYHTVQMLESVIYMPPERRAAIQTRVIELINRKLPTETAGGQISLDEAAYFISLLKQVVQ